MNKFSIALSVFTIGIAPSFSQAAEPIDTGQEHVINPVPKVSGFYIAGTIGTGKLRINRDDGEYTARHYFDQESLARNDNSSGAQSLQLLAGYQFNRIVAIEINHADYINNLDFRGFVPDKGEKSYEYHPQQIHAKPSIYASQANVGYTFANGIRPFALTGLSLLHLNADKDVYDANTFRSQLSLRIGAGVEYAPVTLQGWAFRSSWTADFTTMKTEDLPDNPILLLFPSNFSDGVRLSSFNFGTSYKF